MTASTPINVKIPILLLLHRRPSSCVRATGWHSSTRKIFARARILMALTSTTVACTMSVRPLTLMLSKMQSGERRWKLHKQIPERHAWCRQNLARLATFAHLRPGRTFPMSCRTTSVGSAQTPVEQRRFVIKTPLIWAVAG